MSLEPPTAPRFKTFLLTASASLCLSATGVLAAPAPTPAANNGSASGAGTVGVDEDTVEPVEVDVITVYGTSNMIPAFEYPGQVSVIDKQEIDARLVSSVADALRDVPGLQFAGGPRRTGEVPALRGLSGENVLILLDGARQSFLSAHDGRFFIDPDLLARAEVVRGPASALYGSGALGGVLAFETLDAGDILDPDESVGIRLRTGYQSVLNEYSGTATAFGRKGAFDALGSVTFRDSGDITLGTGAELPSNDDIASGLLKLGYEPSEALRIEGSWQRFTNTAIEPNNGQGLVGLNDGERDVEKDITSDNLRLSAEYDPENPMVDATVTVYGSTSEVEEFDATLPRTATREVSTIGVSARNASRFDLGSVQLTATFGGDWFRDEQSGLDTTSITGRRDGVPEGEIEFTGLFAQLEATVERPLGLPGQLFVLPGLRFDSFKSVSDVVGVDNENEEFSPRFAMSYQPVEWLSVFGSYSEGFRAPSLNELYLEGAHFPVPHPVLFDPRGRPPNFTFVNNDFVPNPDLESEDGTTIEGGFGVDFQNVLEQGDRFQTKISYFESEVDGLIDLFVDFAFDPTCFAPPFFPCSAGTTSSRNVAQAELSGMELEARYDAQNAFLRAAYSSIDGENVATGADLGTLTPDRLALDGGVKFDESRGVIGARLQFAEEFERTGATRTGAIEVVETRDDYAVLDLYAIWRPRFVPGIRIDLGVDNVTDQNFERVFQGVPEPGRNYKVSVGYGFTY